MQFEASRGRQEAVVACFAALCLCLPAQAEQARPRLAVLCCARIIFSTLWHPLGGVTAPTWCLCVPSMPCSLATRANAPPTVPPSVPLPVLQVEQRYNYQMCIENGMTEEDRQLVAEGHRFMQARGSNLQGCCWAAAAGLPQGCCWAAPVGLL